MRKVVIGTRRLQQIARRETNLLFVDQVVNNFGENVQPPTRLIINNAVENSYDFNSELYDCDSLPDALNNYSDSEEEDVDFEESRSFDLISKLKDGSLAFCVNQKQFTSLLKILKQHPCFEKIPSASGAILRTSQEIFPVVVPPGEFLYFGVRREIDALDNNLDHTLELQVNIDGLPIFKSSSLQFWPILGFFVNVSVYPFVIGLYSGIKKPSDVNIFLEPFVREFNQLREECTAGGNPRIKIHSFICDAPAKSCIKCCKGHTGYFGCDKCQDEGVYKNNRMTFSSNKSQLRTDASFRAKTNFEHHTGTTILEEIPDLNLVDQFPCECMHLLALGVVKKLLHVWIDDKPGAHKLSGVQIKRLSDSLILKSSEVVREFSRKPRSLTELPRWKATEFRQFLLICWSSCA
ncbi:hypothetical protein Fcan01_15862 [Folsomia candida]|uniref:Uncharacterized protein n=1 Tax=Folsomia candida TaxID=158441 RepID=A0A226DX33_FOLCA|nr:hypothetical protein Fcan01_15862 [Folsomia candida]